MREKEKYQIDTIFSEVHLVEDYNSINSIFYTEECEYINRDCMYFVIMGCDRIIHFVRSRTY